MVKVGLVTSSSGAAPRPATRPLASVVFPAPSSPKSRTKTGGVSSSASCAPNAIVSSGEWVTTLWASMSSLCARTPALRDRGSDGERVTTVRLRISSRLTAELTAGFVAVIARRSPQGFGQSREQVRGKQGQLPPAGERGIAGRAVPIHGSRNHSLDRRLRVLREQSRNHSGEHVAGPGRGHARIAGRVHIDLSAGFGDERAVAFEHHVSLMLDGELSGHLDPLGLDLVGGEASQAGHFSRVRRQDELTAR